MSLTTFAKRISKLKNRAHNDPLSYYCPTPSQMAYICDPSPTKALIGGNQTGKTHATCALLLYSALGRHPTLKTDPPPIEAWLVTHSHEQSRTIQQKLYDLTPKDELHPDCEFVRGKGFRGLAPVVRFRNGSIIRIKTANQGLGLESASCSLVCVDEPVSIATYNALQARVTRGGKAGKRGTVALSLTPVGDVDVTYLKDLIDAGKISAHYSPLTVEATTPRTWSGRNLKPLLSAAQVEAVTSSYLPIDRDARVFGSFDVAPIGVIFENFTDDMISSQPVPRGGEPYHFCIGLDHGSLPNSNVAILSCVSMKDPQEPRVYVLGEYVSGQAPPEHHAQAILEMCKTHGVDPKLCKWTGDGEHNGSRGRDGHKMSNIMIMRALENILGYPPRNLPWTIRRARKGRHSVYFGASLIHSIQSRKHFYIRPECTKTIRSIRSWTMKRKQYQRSRDPFQHCIDALRYGLLPVLDYRIDIPHKIRVR